MLSSAGVVFMSTGIVFSGAAVTFSEHRKLAMSIRISSASARHVMTRNLHQPLYISCATISPCLPRPPDETMRRSLKQQM